MKSAARKLSADEFASRARQIRWIILDADGVLTDGSIVYDERGREIKRFHVRDGFAIGCWRRAGHRVALISGRASGSLALRCRELGISPVIQGAPDKVPAFLALLASEGATAEQVCVVGDDFPDLPIILAAGLGVAVADADATVRAQSHWTTQAPGGRGAVREVVERILAAQGHWDSVMEHYGRPAGAAPTPSIGRTPNG